MKNGLYKEFFAKDMANKKLLIINDKDINLDIVKWFINKIV